MPTEMNAILCLLVFLFSISGIKAHAQDTGERGANHRPVIVINYVTDKYDRHFYSLQPQVEYFRLPELPPPSHIPPGAWGYNVSLRVATDGQKATTVDLTGGFMGIEDLSERTKRLAKKRGITISESDLRGLVETAKENVLSWRFRKHEPTTFSTTWRFVLGEIIGDDEETDDLDDVLEADTVTLSAPWEVEVVVFPRLGFDHGAAGENLDHAAASAHNAPLQVECLRIPEHPRQLRPGFKVDVTMKVKTDGKKVVSAEAIGGTDNPVYKNSSIDYVKSWTFKEHEPTEFVTQWKYDYETLRDPKPNVITLDLPHRVEVKSFHVMTADPVLHRKKMRRKDQK